MSVEVTWRGRLLFAGVVTLIVVAVLVVAWAAARSVSQGGSRDPPRNPNTNQTVEVVAVNADALAGTWHIVASTDTAELDTRLHVTKTGAGAVLVDHASGTTVEHVVLNANGTMSVSGDVLQMMYFNVTCVYSTPTIMAFVRKGGVKDANVWCRTATDDAGELEVAKSWLADSGVEGI